MTQAFTEERKAVQGQIQGGQGGLQTAPTTGVFVPRGAHTEASQNTRLWASAFDKFSVGAGALAQQEKAKQDKADFLNGQMDSMAGKTFQELKDAGANNTTLQGFTTMQAVTFNNKWQAEQLRSINDGTHASLDPLAYKTQLQEQFKDVLTGNEYTDNVTTALAAETMPKLLAAQMTAHSAWKENRTYNATRDAIVTASVNNDSEQLTALFKPEARKTLGLTEERWNDAVAEAVTLSYENGSTTLPNMLGLNAFTKGSIESAKLPEQLKPEFRDIIATAAEGSNVPVALLMRIAATESGGRYDAIGAMTKYGTAKGPFQFIDSTWKQYGEGSPHDPVQASKAAVKYFSHLSKLFGGDEVLMAAAYNTGEGNVKKWLNKGRPRGGLAKETEDYIQKNFGIDVYSSDSSSLLTGKWSAAQQSKMMAGKIKWDAAQEEKWSLNNAKEIVANEDAYRAGEITYEELEKRNGSLGLSDAQAKSAFTSGTELRRKKEHEVDWQLNGEQTKALAVLEASITDDTASLYAAQSQVDRDFADKPPAVREGIKNKLTKAYDTKIGKALSDTVIPLVQTRPEVHDPVRALQQEMNEGLINPLSNPTEVLANARSKLKHLAETSGWTPQEIATANAALNTEFGQLQDREQARFRKLREDKEKADEKLATVNQAIRSKTIYNLEEKEQAQAFEILLTNESYRTQAQLNAQFGRDGWGAEQFHTAYGANVAEILASQGAVVRSKEMTNYLHGIATPPALDKDGTISPEYLGKVHMAYRLMDLNAGLATKYLGDDAALVIQTAISKGSQMDPQSAVVAAHQELRSSGGPEAYKKVGQALNDSKIQDKMKEGISKEIRDATPSWLSQVLGGHDELKNPPTETMIKNLENSAIFQGKVHANLTRLRMKTPGAEIDNVMPIAIRGAMTEFTPVGGSWVTGSAQNGGSFYDSVGLPKNHQIPWAGTEMAAGMLNAFAKMEGWNRNIFEQYKSPSGHWSDAAFGDFASGVNWRAEYDPGRDLMQLTVYNSETGAEREPMYFSGRAMAAVWMGERIAELDSIKNIGKQLTEQSTMAARSFTQVLD